MSEKIIGVMAIIAAILTAICIMRYAQEADAEAAGAAGTAENRRVVLDAGHGGMDPGKVGVNGALEKEINLSIVLKLKALLEANDIEVILTRDTDAALYEETDVQKKVSDLKRRVKLIEDSGAALTVSIHQNSFTSENIKGAQVFYYGGSTESEAAAKLMQKVLKQTLRDENDRQCKANNDYYMLKKVTGPIIIVECGFLSNSAEAELLIDDSYQEKLAWAVHLGIMNWFNRVDVQ